MGVFKHEKNIRFGRILPLILRIHLQTKSFSQSNDGQMLTTSLCWQVISVQLNSEFKFVDSSYERT
jgi:hypothetical protein